jgi:DNA-binding CsgD family transcriptional regulator
VSKKEQVFIAMILSSISAMTIFDLITDSKEGVSWWHSLVEGLVVVAALIGTFLIMRGTFKLKKSLKEEREISGKLQEEARIWKEQSKKFLNGLSQSIDFQLKKWELTKSEKEVTFLLLKGFSLKEVAEIRGTTEKTARAQSATVYAKAGISGRSQLSAFFLEDLLPPQTG